MGTRRPYRADTAAGDRLPRVSSAARSSRSTRSRHSGRAQSARRTRADRPAISRAGRGAASRKAPFRLDVYKRQGEDIPGVPVGFV